MTAKKINCFYCNGDGSLEETSGPYNTVHFDECPVCKGKKRVEIKEIKRRDLPDLRERLYNLEQTLSMQKSIRKEISELRGVLRSFTKQSKGG